MSQPFYKVNLGKADSEKQFVNLQKVAQQVVDACGLNGQKAKVGLVLDDSGSIGWAYSKHNGTMQAIVDKLLALGVRFDDNGAIDMFKFSNGCTDLGELHKDDFYGYVGRKLHHSGGGTSYSSFIELIIDKYAESGILPQAAKNIINGIIGGIGRMFGFGKKKEESVVTKDDVAVEEPAYIMIVTDGEPLDSKDHIRQLLEGSQSLPIYWQFVGIGESFGFLQEVSRKYDNVGFFSMNDFMTMGEDELYKLMLAEFPQWLNNARAKGIVK